MKITKSDYMLYLRHPAWLWIKKHRPELIPPVDEATQALFDSGNKFEPYAEALFPEGVTLGFTDYDEYLSLPKRTQDAINRGDNVLFQPRFIFGDFTCICDIVSFVEDGVADLYEIKASTGPKLEHEYDLAFQAAVLRGAGVEVRKVFVIHVNNQYVRNGDIEVDKITNIADITEKVESRREETVQGMAKSLEVAKSAEMPDPDPKYCGLKSAADWQKIYINFAPQPTLRMPSVVSPKIQENEIKAFLDKFKFPLYFFDYETMMSLIPLHDGHRPYQQIPFQYSLHVLEHPNAEIQHLEYLHQDSSNPAAGLVEQLVKHIGPTGSVITWNQTFEKTVNRQLAEAFPHHAKELLSINDRVLDLMIPFKSQWYYDPRFNGSASIKYVLPILCPDLSYEALNIKDGGSAQRYWMSAVLDQQSPLELDKVLGDLHEYCKLDTWAMVRIWQELAMLTKRTAEVNTSA